MHMPIPNLASHSDLAMSLASDNERQSPAIIPWPNEGPGSRRWANNRLSPIRRNRAANARIEPWKSPVHIEHPICAQLLLFHFTNLDFDVFQFFNQFRVSGIRSRTRRNPISNSGIEQQHGGPYRWLQDLTITQ